MERTVRQFHKSPGMLDPDRGAAMIAEDFGFEDIARGETLGGNEVYKPDQHHWREAFPDGLCEAENVIVSQCGKSSWHAAPHESFETFRAIADGQSGSSFAR